MATTLYHTSGYQTLVDDLLEFTLNRVTIQPSSNTEDPSANMKTKVFSLDSETDQFWKTFAGKMIPEAVEAHSTQLQQVSNQVARIKSETGGGTGIDTENSQTSSLLSTVQSLPALLEKKKTLETHLEIIKATMNIISQREVYKFAELEESIINSQHGDKAKVLELLQNPDMLLEDKIRALAVYLLVMNPSSQDVDQLVGVVEQFVGELEENKRLFKTITYIKRMLSLTGFGMNPPSVSSDSTDPTNVATATLWSFADRAAQSLMQAQKHVKGLVGGEKLLRATRMIDAVCKDATSPNVAAEVDAEFLYFDPKMPDGQIPASSRIRTQFNRGILFMVGGGNFAEYHNLRDYASGKISESGGLGVGLGSVSSSSQKISRQFIYGCTEVVNAKNFMNQIADCC